ncbi:hypothetical protein AAG906_001560 [Vitis piasezkii]|uniref:Uncharacterized protein n=1 Tax=Vitis vinifera TaxID=29760 RepID=D7SIA5_VITVI
MASNLRLLVILLGFSYLICVNAVPVARTRRMHGYHQGHQVSEVSFLNNMEKIWEEQNIRARMDAELNDYPGSGANNRHTPNPH